MTSKKPRFSQTVTNTGEAARVLIIEALRRSANELEAGAVVVSGGVVITNPEPGLSQIDSDIIIRKRI